MRNTGASQTPPAEYGRPWYTYYIDRAQEYGILPQAMASKRPNPDRLPR